MILIIKHIANEGPGTIEAFFKKEGFELKEINLYDGESFPKNLTDIDAIICMGGPMNVYEESKYPFLKSENAFLQKVLKEEIPFLGICLGSQLLAKAAGAKVSKAPKGEIGWFKARLTEEGTKDPLFKKLDGAFEVFQWHEDTFEIPKRGKHLAASTDCIHQAFKVGPCAYGLQFHVEVTGAIIEDWVQENFKGAKKLKEGQEMVAHYLKNKNRYNNQAETIYRNFLQFIEARRAIV